MRKFRYTIRAAGLFLFLAALAGCGGGGASVEGTVTFNGEPVEEGGINFVPADGKGTKMGAEIKNGKYAVPSDRGAQPGNYKVEVYWNKKTGRTLTDTADTGAKTSETKQVIPEQFNTKTTLTADLKGGSNAAVNFDLKGTAASGKGKGAKAVGD
ncbi:hypothetical protein R5W23_002661 [Gemmata sp. JC673]|uniref:Carboxypeptidase regulatory-like domain-containing protein n=1 Tax=Gemmata algarum TaxID=2975278 RepID=A0ABU5F1L4_9BACT|nr:hypothetical protein [Gemmata algarum]MDY3561384.1 hypothetical protein [Gemmata algarum]